MGKKFFLAVVTILLFVACAACTEEWRDREGLSAVSAATLRREPSVRTLLERFMTEEMADGIVKIAVIVNLEDGVDARQFVEGSVWEGRSMGFTVDAFITGADERRGRELAGRIALADYDGVIFTNADSALAYDMLRPIADRGISIVTFEASPFRDGKTIGDITATSIDNYELARLSLETLIYYSGGEDRPPRVIRIETESNVPYMIMRDKVFNDFLNEGRIEEAARITLHGVENSAATAREGLAAILPRFPPGTVDAVWSPHSEFAKGCAEALAAAGRTDIGLFSIGISHNALRSMQRHSDIWLASAAVDSRLAGKVCMRILAAKLSGEEVPDAFYFEPALVRTEDLNRNVNIANISIMLHNWGDGTGLFDSFPWMKELKTAEGRNFRIRPVTGGTKVDASQ